MKRFMVIVTIIISLVTAANAYAQEGSYSIGVKAGLFSPNSEVYENSLLGYGTGLNIGAAFGYKVVPNLMIEAGVSRYSSERKGKNETSTVSVIPITLTPKVIVPLGDGKVEVFGGLGLGYYLASAKLEWEEEKPDKEEETIKESVSMDGSGIGFHFVGGGDFQVSKNIALGLELKWFSVKPELEGEVKVGKETTIIKMKANYGGIIFNVVGKYRF